MRGFLLKAAVAGLLVLVAHLIAGLFADGRMDDAYLRFTGERRASMILGTSRAAQGLRPDVIDQFLGESDGHGSLFNFAFTIVHSPYGPSYVQAVEGKLDKRTTNGVFLLAIDPWSLCDRFDKQGHLLPMQETKHDLINQWTYSGTPNYEYLIRHTPSGWGSLIGGPLHRSNEFALLHEDGWLEIQIPMDSAAVRERSTKKLEYFRTVQLPRNRPSEHRIQALERMIDLLRQHGRVYLLRMPVSDPVLAVEEQVWPGFDQRIQGIAATHAVPYWNLMPERSSYTYTDGNHIDRVSSKELSTEVGRRLSADLATRRHEQ